MKRSTPLILAFVLGINIFPGAGFAGSAQDVPDEEEGDVKEEIFTVQCDCLIDGESVGSASGRSAALQHSRWQQEISIACRQKYGKKARAGSCDTVDR